MRLNASVFYGLYRPSECDLRPYLQAKGVVEGKPSPYEEVIIALGRWHEERQLGKIGPFVDLRTGTEDDRIKRTIQAVKDGAPALYQPLFRTDAQVGGQPVTLVGEPDFLIKDTDGYRITDAKIARRITEKDHPEILLQLGLYGWLFEQTFKIKPKRLEVLAGTGKLEEVPMHFIENARAHIEYIVQLLRSDAEPFSPVGWTKCSTCGFNDRCWTTAVESKNVATVPGVDQNLTRALRERGISRIDELLREFDESGLANFQKPWGNKTQKVGKAAEKILRFARALSSGKEEVLQTPPLPAADNYVMFDLEGLPPQLDELDKIYLWGLQVFGAKPSKYLGKIADIGPNGDRAGWDGFLEAAKSVFDSYGDVPFIHWTHYERTKVTAYVERYGDKNGVAERLKRSLVDLFPITQNSIALPIPSYSLKVVEKYIGYKRSQTEYGGDWAMAAFIKATETSDENKRRELLECILTYNREDLAATWAVFEWLRTKKANNSFGE